MQAGDNSTWDCSKVAQANITSAPVSAPNWRCAIWRATMVGSASGFRKKSRQAMEFH